MTQEQKIKLNLHVALCKPHSRAGEEKYYMNNGDIIQFTDCVNFAKNSVYEINNDSHWKIWYSQMANFFFTDDFVPMITLINFSNGESYEFRDLDSAELYNRCKGRKFRVKVIADCKYVFNDQSKTMDEKELYSYLERYNYIVSCIEENRIKDIGDLLKTANAYSLQEV